MAICYVTMSFQMNNGTYEPLLTVNMNSLGKWIFFYGSGAIEQCVKKAIKVFFSFIDIRCIERNSFLIYCNWISLFAGNSTDELNHLNIKITVYERSSCNISLKNFTQF